MTKLIAILDKVLVRMIKPEEQVKNGVILPYANRPWSEGIVYAIGENVKGVEVGDTVFTHPYVGSSFKYNEEEFHTIEARDVWCVIKN